MQCAVVSDNEITMDEFIVKNGKKLRLGYTTGSCAAAAAKAAAWMLLTGTTLEYIGIHTPKGVDLKLAVLDIKKDSDKVSCAIEKDSGDDPGTACKEPDGSGRDYMVCSASGQPADH